ncbi:MAG: tetratricopeptide repeat protein [Bacteroidota bacterium]
MPQSFITLICCFLLTTGLSAQQSKLAAAQDALAGGDATTQITTLDSLLTTDKARPALYQALGNAHYERGDYGRAILNYERGLRLKPGNTALKNNLQYVREEAGITRAELPDFFLLRGWRAVGAALGAGTLFWLAMLFWWLAVAGAVVWFLRRGTMEEKKRFALLPSAFLFLIVAGLCFALGNSRNQFLEHEQEAILIAKSTDLRVAPGPQATLEETLNAGLKLRILDVRDGYVKVSLEDGKQGYVLEEAVERI